MAEEGMSEEDARRLQSLLSADDDEEELDYTEPDPAPDAAPAAASALASDVTKEVTSCATPMIIVRMTSAWATELPNGLPWWKDSR